MRRVVSQIMEIAQLHNKDDNAKCAQIQEAYSFIDSELDGLDHPSTPSSAKLEEALVVGDFPLYFARTLSRKVYERYKYRRGDWRDYTFPDTAPDYSTMDRFRFTEFDRLVKRREKAEMKAGYIYEERKQLAVEDYAKQIDFSRRILVNDDLGAFNDIPRKMADSANRFEDFFVSALYDNALTQAWLIGLGALYAGTGALTTANLAIAWNAFVQRTDVRGNPLRINPRYLVIPPVLRLAADGILQASKIGELATNMPNVLQGRLEVKEDPYITWVGANIPWYLFADPNDVPAVTVVRMQGYPRPQLYAKAPDKMRMSTTGRLGRADWRWGSFLTGDIELSIETIIGARTDAAGTAVGVTDQYGIYYSNGTTP